MDGRHDSAKGRQTSANPSEIDLFRAIAEAAPDPAVVKDRQGRFLWVNAACAKLMGRSPEDLVGKTDWDVFSPKEAQYFRECDQRVMASGVPETFEEDITSLNGATTYVTTKTPYRDQQGQIIGLIARTTDITERKRAENALRASEARLASIFESAKDAIITSDHQGNILEFNSAAEAMFGYSRGQVVGKPVFDLIVPPSQRQQNREGMARHLATGQSPSRGKPVEGMAMRADGSTFPIEISTSRVDIEGPPLFTGIIRNITERKRAEEALRETTQQLQALVRASPLAVLAFDPAGNIRLWNPAAERIFGWTAEEVLGRPYPAVPKGKEDEFQATLKAVFQGATLTNHEARRMRKDGTLLDISFSVAPIYDPNGAMTGALGVVSDITEQKRVADTLYETTERLQRLVGSAPVAIIAADPEGIVQLWNPAAERIFGWSAQEALGRLLPIIPPGKEDEFRAIHAEAVHSTGVLNRVVRRQRKDGSPIDISISTAALRDAHGNATAVLGIAADVTEQVHAGHEREAALAALAAANRELDAFAYQAAHDLRTPLTAIQNYTELLQLTAPDLSEDGRKALEGIFASTAHMKALIEDLLRFARASEHDLRLDRDVNTEDLVEGVLTDLAPQFAQYGTQVTKDPLPVVTADPMLLRQVFQNLLANAAKYSRGATPPHIHVSYVNGFPQESAFQRMDPFGIAAEGQSPAGIPPIPWVRHTVPQGRNADRAKVHCFFVSDNGVGFGPSKADRLFRAFQRLHGREFEGTGVGLALVRRIVERHGGQVWAEGAVGEGACFCFTLPHDPQPRMGDEKGLV